MTSEAAPAGVKTPWHLWLVGVLAVLWNAGGVFDFTATVTRFEPVMGSYPKEAVDYFYNLPAWRYVPWCAGVFGGFIGSILLLLRMKLAAPVLALSELGAVATFAANLVYPPPPVANDPAFLGVIVVIALALLGYSFWMQRRGVLR